MNLLKIPCMNGIQFFFVPKINLPSNSICHEVFEISFCKNHLSFCLLHISHSPYDWLPWFQTPLVAFFMVPPESLLQNSKLTVLVLCLEFVNDILLLEPVFPASSSVAPLSTLHLNYTKLLFPREELHAILHVQHVFFFSCFFSCFFNLTMPAFH